MYITVIPYPSVKLDGHTTYLNKVTADKIYQFLISTKTRPPTGLLRWREEIDLSDAETVMVLIL